ncbi:MAG TPA: nuclear transport factor 2 family protein [Terriglobales bacterium]|nr:nuclear transport factor 2 family protein [Terriglobales bacterium]
MRTLTVLMCTLAINAVAAPRSSPTDEQAIRRIENQWINASEMPAATRIGFYERVLAPDGVHIVASGQRYTNREILDYYRKHPDPPSPPKARFRQLNVRVYGDTAIADGTTEIAGSKAAEGHENRFTDVFKRRNGRWVAINEQETPVSGETR